jgi:tetratricopeptide (TPR) repeat protein
MEWGTGSYIAFATSPGSTASDGAPADGHGLFTKHLLANLAIPDLGIDELFDRVRAGVYEESGRRQMAATLSALIGEFVFTEQLSGQDSSHGRPGRNSRPTADRALAIAASAVAADSKNPAAHLVQGLERTKAGKLTEAQADFTRAIALNGRYPAALRERGRLRLMAGDSNGALSDLTAALDSDPEDLPARYIRILLHISQGAFGEGVKDSTALIIRRPAAALPYFARCAAYAGGHRYVEAQADCDRAVALDPQLAIAYALRGQVMRARGMTNEAVRDFTAATALSRAGRAATEVESEGR